MSEAGIDSLIAALLAGDCEESVSRARELRAGGFPPEKIVTGGLEAAMTALDAKCTLEQFNLLEIMLAGRAVTEVMKVLYPAGGPPATDKGTIVIATLEGDVHDLGKNILKMVLTGKGYRVVDCGKDCPVATLVEAAAAEDPLAVGVSGLITPIIPLVRQVRERLAASGAGAIPVFAGGAALKQSSAESLKVDFVADSAFDILHYLDSINSDAVDQD